MKNTSGLAPHFDDCQEHVPVPGRGVRRLSFLHEALRAPGGSL